MVSNKNDYVSPFAVHPGETVKEALEFAEMSQADLSLRADISEKTISQILNGIQPVSPETALKLERVLGLSYELLVGMQAQYEADIFRLSEKKRLNDELQYLEKYSCYTELAKYGYVEQTREKQKKVEELLRFFGVNSLGSVQTVCSAAYKKSNKYEVSQESLAAWLRMGTIQARNIDVLEYDRNKLIENVRKMRSLTTESPEKYSRKLIELCAESGVALVFTPHLKKTRVNGSARWISPNRPLIQVSLYNKYADIFWFTLFHEIAHILKHSKKMEFIDDLSDQETNGMEEEANIFAQQVIVPKDREDDFQKLKSELTSRNVRQKIVAFSKEIDIDPGIIAGRIGKELDVWKFVSNLRTKLTF